MTLFNAISTIADLLQPLEALSAFDWITPLSNEVGGYNHLNFQGTVEQAILQKDLLRKQGIACRLEAVGDKWNVYTKERVK